MGRIPDTPCLCSGPPKEARTGGYGGTLRVRQADRSELRHALVSVFLKADVTLDLAPERQEGGDRPPGAGFRPFTDPWPPPCLQPGHLAALRSPEAANVKGSYWLPVPSAVVAGRLH